MLKLYLKPWITGCCLARKDIFDNSFIPFVGASLNNHDSYAKPWGPSLADFGDTAS